MFYIGFITANLSTIKILYDTNDVSDVVKRSYQLRDTLKSIFPNHNFSIFIHEKNWQNAPIVLNWVSIFLHAVNENKSIDLRYIIGLRRDVKH